MINQFLSSSFVIQTLILSFLIQVFFFIYAAIFKSDKVTDLSYGLTFIFLALFLYSSSQNQFFYQKIVLVMIVAWGLRLASYLFIRILKIKTDKRFDGIRENFLKFAKFWFFQAVAVWAISLPSSYLLSLSSDKEISFAMTAGVLIWITGLTIETIADLQKFRFKNKPSNKGKWIESGIWKYSRHPNYFGEMLCWWGIFLFSVPLQLGSSWLTVSGPIFITLILLFASGIPTLEKKYNKRYKNNKKYQKYKKETNLLIPWFKK